MSKTKRNNPLIAGVISTLKEKDLTLSKPFAKELWLHLEANGYEQENDTELFHEKTELLYQFNKVGYQVRIACAIRGEGVCLPVGEFSTVRPTSIEEDLETIAAHDEKRA